MTLKTLLEEITGTLGTVGITFFISVLLCIVFYSLAMRLYYMSVGTPSESVLNSNRTMLIGSIIALVVVVSISGIMLLAKDTLTGIIK